MTDIPDKLIWTLESFAIHQKVVREADQAMALERDRRYSEGAELRAVALKIKETADLAALTLARESQTYKEQQNDALRDKNLSESGVYATNASVSQAIGNLETKIETALAPLVNFVSSQQGVAQGSRTTKAGLYSAIGVTATIVGLLGVLFNLAR